MLKSIHTKLIMLFFVIVIAYRLLLCFSYSPEISVGETNNIWNALNVAAGKLLYTNPEEPPFEIFQYTPLSQSVVISAAKIIDSNSDQYAYYVMVIGRLFSLLFNLGKFFIVYLLLKNILHVNAFLSLSAAVLGFATLTHLAFAIRPDALSMLLTIVSLYLFFKAFSANNSFYYFLTGLFFSIAFFAKQDAVSILAVIGSYLLITQRWKPIFIISTSFVFFWSVFAFTFKELLGEYFMNSIVGGLNSGYEITNAISVLKRFFDIYWFLITVGIFVVFLNAKRLFNSEENKVMLFICIGSFLIAFFTSLKVGAWVNYYSLFIILFTMLIFKSLSMRIDKKIQHIGLLITIVFSCVFLFRQVYHYTLPFLKYPQTKRDYFLTVNNFKSDTELNNSTIFTFDKTLKLLFFKNTILPNTEYYHVSRFKKTELGKSGPEYIIKNDLMDDSQFSALIYYKVDTSVYKMYKKTLNYTVYIHGRQQQ